MMWGRKESGKIVFLVLLMMGHCTPSGMETDEYQKITCREKLYDLEGHYHTSDGELFMVSCPLYCKNSGYNVYGSGPYADRSSVCRAAIHSGKMADDGRVVIKTVAGFMKAFNSATTRNGVSSKTAFSLGVGGFYVLEVTPATMTPNISRVGSLSGEVPKSSKQATTAHLMNPLGTSSPSLKTGHAVITIRQSIDLVSSTNDLGGQQTTKPILPSLNGVVSQTPFHHKAGDNAAEEVPVTTKPELVERTETNSSDKLLSGVEVTGIAVNTDDIFEKSVEKIMLIVMFAVGMIFAIAVMIVRQKRKKLWWRRKHKQSRCDSKDDEELCVCYHTLDASSQGLLYDPDTCNRPCVKKKAEAQDFNLQTRNISLNKQEICYENQCKDTCSGNCNLEMIDF